MSKLAVSRPEIPEMIKEITAAGFLAPSPDENQRLSIEHLYWLVVASQPGMDGRDPEFKCFGDWNESDAVCNGDGNKKVCCLMPLCREMKKIQDALKNGKPVEVKPGDAAAIEFETVKCCVDNPAKYSVPTKVKKPRISDPEKLDQFGFRKSGMISKISSIITGETEESLIDKLKGIGKDPVNEAIARVRFSMAKHQLKNKGYSIKNTDGKYTIVKE